MRSSASRPRQASGVRDGNSKRAGWHLCGRATVCFLDVRETSLYDICGLRCSLGVWVGSMGQVLTTRLTERYELAHPIVLAPMGNVSGGKLAAAVSGAGGLGLIGGGYGDGRWLETEFRAAGNASVGCGFITWSLDERPELLELVLERQPRAIMLSFGDPVPFASANRAIGHPSDLPVPDAWACPASARCRRGDDRRARQRGWRARCEARHHEPSARGV